MILENDNVLSENRKNIAAFFFCLFFLLFVVGVAPKSAITVDFFKSLSFAVLGISVVILFLSSVLRGISLPKSTTILIPLITIFISLLSAYLNGPFETSWGGLGYEIDTIVFTLSFFSVFLAGAIFFGTIRGLHILFGLLISLFVVVSVFEITDIYIFSFITDQTATVVGSWFNLGIFYGFYILLFSLLLEFYRPSGARLALFLVPLVFSIWMLFAIGFMFLWGIISVYFLAIIVFKYIFSFQSNHITPKVKNFWNTIPYYAIALLLVSFFIYFFAGSYIGITNSRNIKENRPSFSSTVSVLSGFSNKGIRLTLFGNGPKEFSEAWDFYRPTSYNKSPFWKNSFELGNSLLLTSMVTIGLLGAISWFLFIIYSHIDFWKVIENRRENYNDFVATIIFGTLASFGWTVFIFYIPGVVPIAITTLITGAMVGFSSKDKFLITVNKSYWRILAFPVLIISIVIIIFFGLSNIAERFLSIVHYQKSLASFRSNNFDDAMNEMKDAIGFRNSDLFERTISEIYQAKLEDLIRNVKASDSSRKQFEILAKESVGHAKSAVDFNKKNYLNNLSLGNAYTILAIAGVADLKGPGTDAFVPAINSSPVSPLPHFLFAKFLAIIGERGDALKELNSALLLKPDYDDALSLLSNLNGLPIKRTQQNDSTVQPEAEKGQDTSTTTPKTP